VAGLNKKIEELETGKTSAPAPIVNSNNEIELQLKIESIKKESKLYLS